MNIAVIGGGGAGLVSAWLLDTDHPVTLFEQAPRLGGHADTRTITIDAAPVTIDAGFEFFSDRMFPTFNRLLDLLAVPRSPYPMLVTLYDTRGGRPYLLPPIRDGRIHFAALTPRHIRDMLAFSRHLSAARPIMDARDATVTLEAFMAARRTDPGFAERFLIPFLQAGWGVSAETIRTFMVYDILRYAYLNKPTGLVPRGWKEIDGGTQTYVQAVVRALQQTTLRTGVTVDAVIRSPTGAGYRVVSDDGVFGPFDHVIVATNANQASRILRDLPGHDAARALLSQVSYYETTIAIHGDTRLLPPQRRHWSTVNIRWDGRFSQFSIWKAWKSRRPVVRSWITYDDRLPDPLYDTATYWHPRVDHAYFDAQRRLTPRLTGENVWLAGMYMHDVDCHESVVLSAANVVRALAPGVPRLAALAGSAS